MRIGLFVPLAGLLLALGLPGVALAGATSGVDTDGDGVDDAFDNCRTAKNGVAENGNQVDADGDGCGNFCDGDFNQDGVVGIPDFGIFRQQFGSSGGPADLNGDGVVGIPDFGRFRQLFGGAPGPSGSPLRTVGTCFP